MKLILISFGVFFILNSVQSLHVYFPKETAACGKEVGLPASQAKEALERNDLKMGCIIACILNKFNAITDGKFVLRDLYATLEPVQDSIPNYEEVKEGVGVCYSNLEDLDGKTECELGLQFGQCMSIYMRT